MLDPMKRELRPLPMLLVSHTPSNPVIGGPSHVEIVDYH